MTIILHQVKNNRHCPCIDYVIAHEVCHLKYPTHDTRFCRMLCDLFPNWAKIKARLEQVEL